MVTVGVPIGTLRFEAISSSAVSLWMARWVVPGVSPAS